MEYVFVAALCMFTLLKIWIGFLSFERWPYKLLDTNWYRMQIPHFYVHFQSDVCWLWSTELLKHFFETPRLRSQTFTTFWKLVGKSVQNLQRFKERTSWRELSLAHRPRLLVASRGGASASTRSGPSSTSWKIRTRQRSSARTWDGSNFYMQLIT